MDFNQWLQDFLQRSLDFLPHLIFGLIIFALSLYLSVPASRWAASGDFRYARPGVV